jgi:HK97 gp10 family phage protein
VANKVKVITTGNKAIDAKLRKLKDEKLAKRIVRTNIRASLKPMLGEARANVPVKSGRFKRLLKIRTRRSRTGIILIIGLSKKDLGEAEKAGFYPIAVEFGTKDQEPQAPMRHAFDAGAEAARDQCLKGIRADVLRQARN